MTVPRPPAWLRVAAGMTVVGWGANQFAPMLLVYRLQDGLSQGTVTFLFAVYVAGLVPTLLAAAWWSRHVGKRPFVRAALVLSGLASVALAVGASHVSALVVGRLLAGMAAGCVMAPGTAWVKEWSADAPVGTGARRSTVALSTGFGAGPLVAGACAQWLPWPQVLPYAVHLVLLVLVAPVAWATAERDAGDHPTPTVRAVLAELRSRWFLRGVVPSAPWVFGAAATSFVTVPILVADDVAAVAFAATGVVAGTTLGTGVLVQPVVRRREVARHGSTLPLGLLLLCTGMALAVLTAWVRTAWLLPATSVVLGAAYGTLMVAGLRAVEVHAPPHLLAPVSAVFYCLTYLGFFAPFVTSSVSRWVPLWESLAIGAGIALATLVLALVDRTGVAGGGDRSSGQVSPPEQAPEQPAARERV